MLNFVENMKIILKEEKKMIDQQKELLQQNEKLYTKKKKFLEQMESNYSNLSHFVPIPLEAPYSNNLFQTISAMPQYESLSAEEIRLSDYRIMGKCKQDPKSLKKEQDKEEIKRITKEVVVFPTTTEDLKLF
ncbi:nuclear pore complex protein nup98-nup96 [Anaeramoeba flamelloides]|uniref:Nuclear pore complex protein nup98-nup96 n=1 Tax=Anaeramoeba flamelloides TaxID=1746091 RepID=A0AAV7YZW3_9EUKA|nr:nuclear pore complex protein nup98-nup96 [Anaeramoeba flamelloides]KAJ6227390.1 nuclear pore complex protein nup98-nup96 [Anaeramoeba flamelloides]